MALHTIYKATSATSGKSYIGQTINLIVRKRSHVAQARRKDYTNHFYNAMCKYGAEGISWEIICVAGDQEIANALECFYISHYDTFKNGYNLTEGGGGCSGYKLPGGVSKETRKNLSKAQTGKKHTPETKAKIATSHNGKEHSEETKAKIAEYRKGKKHSAETRKKIAAGIRAYWDEKRKAKDLGERGALKCPLN